MDSDVKERFDKICKCVENACKGFINKKITNNTIKQIRNEIGKHLDKSDPISSLKLKKIINSWNFECDNDTLIPGDGKTAITFFLLIYKVETLDNILSLLEFPDLYEYQNKNIYIKWENKKIYIQPVKPLQYIEVNFVIDKDGNLKT